MDHQCSCHISYPLIDKVKGRQSDNLVLPDGDVLSGEYLTTIFDDYTNAVKQFQVVQRKNLSIELKVSLYDSADENFTLKVIEQELGVRINHQVPFSLVFVNDINKEKGKLQFIIKE